jgi:hypothetical protein
MLRGLLLIVVAVVLGVVVLRATDDPAAVAEERPVVASAPVEEDRLDREGATRRERTDPGEDDEGATGGGVETGADDETATGRDDETATEDDDESATEAATEGDDDAATASSTTTTVAGGRRSGDVSVLVANGSGVTGLAGELSERVGAAGYETAQPANIDEDEPVSSSVVYYADGYADEAQAVAATLSPPPPVAPMPDPAPVADLRGATVLVVAGPDLADD